MKDKRRPQKVRLNLVESDDQTLLLGIVSHEPCYKLAIALNKNLRLSLKNINPIIIPDNGKESQTYFSRFSDTTLSPDIYYFLVSNKSDGRILFRKFSRIDYFLAVFYSFSWQYADKLTGEIRKTEGITAIFPINSNEINYEIFRS